MNSTKRRGRTRNPHINPPKELNSGSASHQRPQGSSASATHASYSSSQYSEPAALPSSPLLLLPLLPYHHPPNEVAPSPLPLLGRLVCAHPDAPNPYPNGAESDRAREPFLIIDGDEDRSSTVLLPLTTDVRWRFVLVRPWGSSPKSNPPIKNERVESATTLSGYEEDSC